MSIIYLFFFYSSKGQCEKVDDSHIDGIIMQRIDAFSTESHRLL